MPFTVPIDRSTVRRNPNAGNRVYYQLGRAEERVTHTYSSPDGTRRRDVYVDGVLVESGGMSAGGGEPTLEVVRSQPVQPLYSLTPEPAWWFEYVPTRVECAYCGASFPHTELGTDADDAGEDYHCSDTVCPRCGAWDCCQLVYENPDTAEFEAAHPR